MFNKCLYGCKMGKMLPDWHTLPFHIWGITSHSFRSWPRLSMETMPNEGILGHRIWIQNLQGLEVLERKINYTGVGKIYSSCTPFQVFHIVFFPTSASFIICSVHIKTSSDVNFAFLPEMKKLFQLALVSTFSEQILFF